MNNLLEVQDLIVKAGDTEILSGVSLQINSAQCVVIMGPNGSGKSTLVKVLMGHPDYEIVSGRIIFKGQDITAMKTEERSALGLFLSFQEPKAIAGLEYFPFLFDAYKSLAKARGQEAKDIFAFKKEVEAEMQLLQVKSDWSERQLNQDFSGGEKKKSELLQMALAQPNLAILDEIDSGLDVDALELAGQAIQRAKDRGTAMLVVTHYNRILKYLMPEKVLVMSSGKIISSGGPELAVNLERDGFNSIAN